MEINWLWDSRLSKDEVRKILKDQTHSKFDFYSEKLLSRTSDPSMILSYIDEVSFCRKWPMIKKRMRRNRWLSDRISFWQTIYERIHEKLSERGIKIRRSIEEKIPQERIKLAHQIRNLRTKLGYTQQELARKLGVIQQYISKIESGRENVSVDTLKRIADAFGKRVIIRLG
jgi:DNA-binding XRE family transcriptional regulator